MADQGPLSGFRDMLAETMIPRQKMLTTIQEVYERFGFNPLKTPTLERLETLTGKYGEEGEKLMYKFEDNGGRQVAMRYDMTVPLARVVEQYGSEIAQPWYKRYVVGDVWRGDRPQAGRYREFTQFDADIVGTASPLADAEIVAVTATVMRALGADTIVRVNNRLILDGLVQKANVESGLTARRFIGTIDKLDKIGLEGVLKEITDANGKPAAGLVEEYLTIQGSSEERLAKMSEFFSGVEVAEAGIQNLTQLFTVLRASGFTDDQIIFDPTIARGLDYYTGVIFETNLKDLVSIGSVCSGGRYDNLVEAMGGPDTPATGTSIGVDRLFEGLRQLGLLEEAKTTTKVLITNFAAEQAGAYAALATQLRNAGIATEVFYEDTRLGKQLTFASKQGIPFVVLMGPAEQEQGIVKVRTMATGEEATIKPDELVGFVNNALATI